MKRLTWLFIIVVLIIGISGCARVDRVANDINWVIFDGQPSRDN